MLLVRLIVWVALLAAGFALTLLPATHGDVGRAFNEAGSSMFTLGYAPPTNGGSTVLDYVAAYTGPHRRSRSDRLPTYSVCRVQPAPRAR